MSAMDKRSAIFLDEMGIGVQWQLRQRPAAPAAGELPAEAEPLADAAQDDIAPPTMEAAELPGPEHLAATAAAPAAATAAVNTAAPTEAVTMASPRRQSPPRTPFRFQLRHRAKLPVQKTCRGSTMFLRPWWHRL
jgi:DNA polymerase